MAGDQRTRSTERVADETGPQGGTDRGTDAALIDPRDAAFFVRPDYHEVLARLRAEDPVHECGPGFWALSRYEDIRDLSRDPQDFCSGRGALVNDPLRTAAAPMSAPSILHMDPPEHADFRRLVNRRFSPRALSGLAESIRASASGLLDAVETTEEIDFVSELAAPFPLTVIAELLGIEEADRENFRHWSDAADRVARPAARRDRQRTRGALGLHRRAHPEEAGQPGDDLVSLLVASEVGGCPLSKEELFMFLLTLLVAGNETTRTLLSGSALVLDEHAGPAGRADR